MTPPTPAMPLEIMKTMIPDARDVDARRAARLRVAADRVDVASERRPLGDERPEDQEPDDQQQHERHAAVLVADRDDDEGGEMIATIRKTTSHGSRKAIP